MREKNNNLGSPSSLTQTSLYSQRSRLDASNFGFKKKRDYTIHIAKTKAIKLICAFVFAQTFCWFSYAVAHFVYSKYIKIILCSVLLHARTWNNHLEKNICYTKFLI